MAGIFPVGALEHPAFPIESPSAHGFVRLWAIWVACPVEKILRVAALDTLRVLCPALSAARLALVISVPTTVARNRSVRCGNCKV